MTGILGDFPTVTLPVATLLGAGARGQIYAPPVDVAVYIEDARRQVRTATGQTVISETTLYDDNLTDAALFKAGSLVTMPDRKAFVITVRRRIVGDPAVDHLEIALT